MELTTLWMNEASLQTIFHRLMACCTQLLYDEVEEGRSQKSTLPGIAPRSHEEHFHYYFRQVQLENPCFKINETFKFVKFVKNRNRDELSLY